VKRVTIIAKDVEDRPDLEDIRVWIGDRWVSVDRPLVASVEDVPEPLPAHPGVRFWGQVRGDSPQWWFTQVDSQGRLIYRPSVELLPAHYVYDALGAGLVRLPDPDGAS
jgi:hypothetical protein